MMLNQDKALFIMAGGTQVPELAMFAKGKFSGGV